MHLLVQPGVQKSWQEFARSATHLIALDGYVPEGPRFNPSGPWANFNHHEEVSRLETRATCAQVLIALRQGLMSCFRPELTRVHVNDCDEDVCLSVFLLRNHEVVSAPTNPLLNRLVFMEDMLDTTGGAYAFPDTLESLHQLLWVFEPYHEFRISGGLGNQRSEQYHQVIDAVGTRIADYLAGTPGSVILDTRYEVLDRIKGLNVTLIKEVGKNARLGVYGDGNHSFVAVRELANGSYAYTLARSSAFVPFPIPKLLKALNLAETHAWRGMTENVRGSWGGSDIIAGSPRFGSVLAPDQVLRVIGDAMSHL